MSALGLTWWILLPVAAAILAFGLIGFSIAAELDERSSAARRFMFATAGSMSVAAVSFWFLGFHVTSPLCGLAAAYLLYWACEMES